MEVCSISSNEPTIKFDVDIVLNRKKEEVCSVIVA